MGDVHVIPTGPEWVVQVGAPFGVFLQPILDAAARIIEDEGREFEREHQRPSS